MDSGLLTKAKAVTAREPNIIWVGEAPAPVAMNVGNEWIGNLPDDATQRRGFYHDRAHVLRSVSDGYKLFIGKGGE